MNWNRRRRPTPDLPPKPRPKKTESLPQLAFLGPGSLWKDDKGHRLVIDVFEDPPGEPQTICWRRPDSRRVNRISVKSWGEAQLSGKLVYCGEAEEG